MDMSVHYYVWSAMLKHYQRHMLKLANITPSWKTVLSTIQNDMLHKFIGKAIVSVCIRFGSCVAVAGGHLHCEHCLNMYKQLPFITETLELLIKSCENFDS